MPTIAEISKVAETKLTTFLNNKPVWVFWITYVLLFGVVFGLFYALMSLLVIRWWVMVIVLLLAGMGWGTFDYFTKEQNKKERNSD